MLPDVEPQPQAQHHPPLPPVQARRPVRTATSVAAAPPSRSDRDRRAPASPPPTGSFAAPPELLVDVVLAAVTLTGSLLLLARGGFGSARVGSQLDLPGVLLVAGASLPLLVWRRGPFGVLVTVGAASTVSAGLGYGLGLPPGPAVALYLLAAGRNATRPWTPCAVGIVVALFAALLAAAGWASGTFPGADLLHSGLAWAVAWFAGERTRLRREHIATLEDRAVRAEHEAEQDRLLAVAEERARIARDLHDSAGNAINVIAVRAGAARLRHPHDPERSLAALCAIEEIARQTVEEIDQLVGTLRGSGPLDPSRSTVEAPPRLASLDTLIAWHTATGLVVTLDRRGTAGPLGAATDQAAYRILQEALSNASRHGCGAVAIAVEFADTSLELTVTNPVPVGPAARSSGGHGVIGMHERAGLLGGKLDTECVDGVFRVHTRLPFTPHRP